MLIMNKILKIVSLMFDWGRYEKLKMFIATQDQVLNEY